MTSGCLPVWQRPSPLLPTFDLFDLKYFCVYKVQAIRLAVLSSLRRYHGQRIKLDRSGASAVKTSLDLRLSWARGEWISLLNETVELFRNKEQLRKLNVIQFVGADSHRLEVVEILRPQDWYNTFFLEGASIDREST